MIAYFDNGDVAAFDGLTFRRDKRTGYYLNAKTHKRLHVYVWEFYNGKVPSGYHVHHKDGNKGNNEPDNLTLLTANEHAQLHGSAWSESRKEKARQNLLENALPAAAKWHGSEAGKEWHSRHAKEVQANLSLIKYVCSFCGKEFETKNVYPAGSVRFCSNKCRAANRRKSGVDNVEKKCEKCGKPYFANKYAKTSKCPACRRRKSGD